MLRNFLSLLLLFVVVFFLSISPVFATDRGNNIFGIHISDINEAKRAAELVNSNGGDWGYVSFVINSNDRKVEKWQERMNILNDAHLIPIVRIATYGNGDTWTKPVQDDAHDWAVFLSALRWPTPQKIVVVYNEPNHGYEWGGATNPAEYAVFLNNTIDALKKADSTFVVLNAGFDASAPNQPPRYMDQVAFMDAMNTAVPGIFSKIDAWSSHSYPNPNFGGKVTDTGRGSIRTYEWELQLLKSRYNVEKPLDVYITETGWTSRNTDHPRIALTLPINASNMTKAYSDVWLKDSRIKAVTPFLLTYKQPLFSHFSWLLPDDSPSEVYTAVQALTKKSGDVYQVYDSIISSVTVPPLLQKGREVTATITLQNNGNAVWSDGKNLALFAVDPVNIISLSSFADFRGNKVYPGQSFTFSFTIFHDQEIQSTSLQFQMKRGSEFFGEKVILPVRIFQPPSLTLAVASPPDRTIEGVKVEFNNGVERDTLNSVSIPKNGVLGTFTSYAFIPGQRTTVRVRAPDRDPVEKIVLIDEGAQTYTFTLPPEYPFWKKLLQLVKRWSNFS